LQQSFGEVHSRILRDGCIDLVFQSQVKQQSRLFASALIERPATIVTDPQSWFAGVRFRPAMSRVVLDDPRECRDREIHASHIESSFSKLEERLMGCRSPMEALSTLRTEIDRRMSRDARRMAPFRVRNALPWLAGDSIGLNIRAVAQSIGVSERSLHRDLVIWTGLRPKLLARILRFQRTLTHIRSGRRPLAAVAHKMGYADQAHMTRDIQRLTGLAPSELRTAPSV
jgi:AraC-like DNA-binding protein